jgi:hypothetical protein
MSEPAPERLDLELGLETGPGDPTVELPGRELPPWELQPEYVPPPRPRRRPPRRTLRGDVRRAGSRVTILSPDLPPPQRRLRAVLAAAALVAFLVLAFTGGGQGTADRVSLEQPPAAATPPPQGAATAFSVATEKKLSPGDRGPAVRRLQRALVLLGLSPGATDGSYGPRTLAAVRAFQISQGIEPTGVATKKTLKALNAALVEAAEPALG